MKSASTTPSTANAKISIGYGKRKNSALFTSLSQIGLMNAQIYNPLYDTFFKLNESNRNTTAPAQNEYLTSIKHATPLTQFSSNVICDATMVSHKENRNRNGHIFIKYIPLLNSVKYICGIYDKESDTVIPSGPNDVTHSKILDANNAAYVDALFVYLSSLSLTQLGFTHGLYYYGSFLGYKKNFTFDILDDLEELVDSEYFQTNKNGDLFTVDDYSEYINCSDDDSNNKRTPIKILGTCDETPDVIDLDLDDDLIGTPVPVSPQTSLELVYSNNNDDGVMDNASDNNIQENISLVSGNDDSDDNSNISVTDEEWDSNSDDSGFGSCNHSSIGDEEIGSNSSSISSDGEEDCVRGVIAKFPVNAVCMERCDGTFEDLMASDKTTNDVWVSALMQIIMSLIAYKKLFLLVHNDLHIGNVMWVSTSQQFLYYKYNAVYYKVPTYGRIFKIIDFGRAIYTIQGHRFCSDDFANKSDAYGQYNTEPFYNPKKPRIEPNHSFDLCRFACSVFTCMADDVCEIPEIVAQLPAFSIIADWCKDDNGNNICYKRNGVERYPGFKLYKMIARVVHNHVPEVQLERNEFKHFRVKKVSNNKIMNLDVFTPQ